MGLRLTMDESVRVLDPAVDRDVFDPLVGAYQHLVGRRGVPMEAAARRVGSRATVAAAMLLHAGIVDAAIVGGSGAWQRHLDYMMPIIPKRPDVTRKYALSALILSNGALFFCDRTSPSTPRPRRSRR